MVGMSAVAFYAVAMLGGEVTLYLPVSKIGGAGVQLQTPRPFPTVASVVPEGILWDDDEAILWDDDTEIAW
jgi:hypothetical protein